ncbi:MAG: DeoR/GlpR family DNA-binding transcription regulator [Spirochaetales bacterium]|nr:DeoR/GlpR family DNA-binding transcription regulator [Spirochaetales bacterium]
MGNGMIPAERQAAIEEYLWKEGFAQVEELSQLLDVSPITIRRDLDLLEKKGLLERSHGGARSPQYLQREALFEEKGKAHREEKAAIGKYVAQLVQPGETIFINSGSTTRYVAAALAGRKDIRIITNNMTILPVLSSTGGPEILVPGGLYRPQSQCLVGEETLAYLRRVFVDRTIMGTDGLDLEKGFTSPVSQEAAVTRIMVEQCQGEVIVAADSSKIGRVSHFKTVELDDVDLVITDGGLESSLKESFVQVGLKIETV